MSGIAQSVVWCQRCRLLHETLTSSVGAKPSTRSAVDRLWYGGGGVERHQGPDFGECE